MPYLEIKNRLPKSYQLFTPLLFSLYKLKVLCTFVVRDILSNLDKFSQQHKSAQYVRYIREFDKMIKKQEVSNDCLKNVQDWKVKISSRH